MGSRRAGRSADAKLFPSPPFSQSSFIVEEKWLLGKGTINHTPGRSTRLEPLVLYVSGKRDITCTFPAQLFLLQCSVLGAIPNESPQQWDVLQMYVWQPWGQWALLTDALVSWLQMLFQKQSCSLSATDSWAEWSKCLPIAHPSDKCSLFLCTSVPGSAATGVCAVVVMGNASEAGAVLWCLLAEEQPLLLSHTSSALGLLIHSLFWELFCAPSWEYLIKLLHKHPKTESAELRHVQPTWTHSNICWATTGAFLLFLYWNLLSSEPCLLEEYSYKSKAVWKLTARLCLGMWRWRELFLVKIQQKYAYRRCKRNLFTGCYSFLLFTLTSATGQVNCP